MGKGFKHGSGGGTSLNFKVVGGTDAPANPKESDIWVNTDTPITGWVFSAEDPLVSDKWAVETEGNKVLFSFAGIDFFKVNNGKAVYTVTAIGGRFWAPFLVSPDPDAVATTTSFRPEEIKPYSNFVTYKGTRYYYGFAGYPMETDNPNATPQYNIPAETLAPYLAEKYYLTETGTVWIQTGTSSPAEFNALKKNGIQVYPMSAKQYIGGTWEDKKAKSYQGGAWKDWATWLYDSGNEFTALTGGWVAANRSSSYTNISGTQFIKNESNLYQKNIEGGSRTAATTNQIDLTPFKELHVIASGMQIGIGVASSLPFSTPTAKIDVNGDSTHATKTEVVLDISAVNSAQRIFVGDGNVVGIYIYKVWLE